MRVGMVCPYAFDVPGGVQYHVRDLTARLAEAGHDVAVLAPTTGEGELPSYLTSSGRPVAVRYNGSVARLNFGPVTSARVSRWLEHGGFDLVHLHEPVTPSVSILALWATTAPVVATFHTSNLRSRAMQAAYPVMRPSLEKINARIAVSVDARHTVRSHLGRDAVVIPNGINVATFAAADPAAVWQGTPEEPTVAFLGRIDEPRKGLDVLLDALPQVLEQRPGTRLLVAGPGDTDAARSRLPDHIQARVTWLGRISDDDKASLLSSVDVYVAPQTGGESFGIVLVEAMAAGAPVLASDLPAFVRVLDRGAAGEVFATGSSAELGDALLGLLADTDRRSALRRSGAERALAFDWSVVTEQVLAVYDTVLEARHLTSEPEDLVIRTVPRLRRPKGERP